MRELEVRVGSVEKLLDLRFQAPEEGLEASDENAATRFHAAEQNTDLRFHGLEQRPEASEQKTRRTIERDGTEERCAVKARMAAIAEMEAQTERTTLRMLTACFAYLSGVRRPSAPMRSSMRCLTGPGCLACRRVCALAFLSPCRLQQSERGEHCGRSG